ncbi:MAG: protein translocase subunit SecD [Chitinivibrionales bacterium]|nr:protein translocase subunit SecD [Chitinivibrionales bacterium]
MSTMRSTQRTGSTHSVRLLVDNRRNHRKDARVPMNRKTIISLVVILVAVIAAGVFLYPSLSYYSVSPDRRLSYVKKHPNIVKQIFNLGLDLQGGMRLVLQVDKSGLKKDEAKDVLDRAYTVIENRINALGVAEPTIQKQGNDRLIVELPGLKDEAAAKDVIGRTAQLQFHLQRETPQLERAVGIIDNVLAGKEVSDTTAPTDSAAIEQEEAQTMAERMFGGTPGDTAVADTATGVVESEGGLLEGVYSFRQLLAAVGDQVGASTKNIPKIDMVLDRTDVRKALESAGLGSNIFLWSHDSTVVNGQPYKTLYYLKGRAEMKGDVIKDAWPELDQGGLSGGYSVQLELNHRGARRFSRVTGANVGRNLAIVLDSTVFSSPTIKQKIPLGRASITGNFDVEEARNLSIVLRAGALPAELSVIEERTIGPSLGQDSVMKGLYAAIGGLVLVVAFMGVYYGLSGVIADFALLLNIVFVLAIMAGMNATLTLPGIAGLVLIIGMSVDANVIVFERIREELRVGKTVRSAIAAGYSRALLTILDANITTLITAMILLWIGTGPIRGFAITLIIGIIVSLFTALFVTRVIFDLITARGSVKKLSI